MTREELIALAKEARLGTALSNSIDGIVSGLKAQTDEVEYLPPLVAAKEREECAGIGEVLHEKWRMRLTSERGSHEQR